jgi:predicted alpha/beta-hydrolase family hydrolase
MRHPFLDAMAERLAERGIATLRYQFPYMERGGRRPDSRPTLIRAVRAAVEGARDAAGDLPLLAGGKSMGGRMTSLATSEAPLPGVRGLVFMGFPLHPAGDPSAERGEHLRQVRLPMLFLQGTRDALARIDLMRELCEGLGPRAALHVVEDADHSFRLPARSARTTEEALVELAEAVRGWAARLEGRGAGGHGPVASEAQARAGRGSFP